MWKRLLSRLFKLSPQAITSPFHRIKYWDGDGSSTDPFVHRTAHGPLDTVNSTNLYCRLILAPYLQVLFPTTGTCLRCGFPWWVTSGHSTQYSPTSACFPLCKDCWEELYNGDTRLPYYLQLISKWETHHPVEKEKTMAIIAAVMEGK